MENKIHNHHRTEKKPSKKEKEKILKLGSFISESPLSDKNIKWFGRQCKKLNKKMKKDYEIS